MKTNSPTHDETARRAQEIWVVRGRPSGLDTAIWFEAERQLGADLPAPPHRSLAESTLASATAGRGLGAVSGGPALAGPVEAEPTSPSPDEIAAKAAFQRKAARAPQFPMGISATKPVPPESGKPLWDKPHSS